MKKLFFLLALYAIATLSYAGGGIAHMYMAEKAIAKLNDPALQQLLIENKDAYLVGSYYPDSGYISPNQYGEDSHWDPFINTFAAYLKDKYQDPIKQNPKLVAFLFGIAAHHTSDILTHWMFYHFIEEHDCPGHWDTSQDYGDIGIDLLLNVDKSLWTTSPKSWWIPVKDLVAVYKRMGKPNYTAAQILYGNSVLFLAGYGERAISAPAYWILRWKMSWTAKHYLDWPKGGMRMDEQEIARYQMELWANLTNKTAMPKTKIANPIHHPDLNASAIQQFARQAIAEGVVKVPAETQDDGSVTIHAPVIEHTNAFNAKIASLIKTITNTF